MTTNLEMPTAEHAALGHRAGGPPSTVEEFDGGWLADVRVAGGHRVNGDEP